MSKFGQHNFAQTFETQVCKFSGSSEIFTLYDLNELRKRFLHSEGISEIVSNYLPGIPRQCIRKEVRKSQSCSKEF